MSPISSHDSTAFAVVRDHASGRWLRFRNPVGIIRATCIDEIHSCLNAIEETVEQHGLHAAGWIAYEAAPAFDSSLTVRSPGSLPLLSFGLYPHAEPFELPPAAAALPDGWKADVNPDAYGQAFDSIRRHIHDGNTYQVNYTHRLIHPSLPLPPWQTFLSLVHAQRAPFGAYIATGPWRLCSASPELFFRLDGTRLESRPMKGTAPRGLSASQDQAQATALLASEKNRAENLMIVDMVRNDMGRIARPGTVEATALCALESYPTLWHLVSTVTAQTDASLPALFAALFPPASITGAPKRRTMQIIAELETSPRQAYTGAIGFLSPGRRAQFNVAIRTLLIDTRTSRAEYGVGGGIVWDSDRQAEQDECRTKARILSTPPLPDFSLLETLLWTPADGLHLLDRHLARLRASADYFGRPCDPMHIRETLAAHLRGLPSIPHRLRLLLAADGTPSVQSQPFLASPPLFRVALAQHPMDRAHPFLYHKTTHRRFYDDAKAAFPLHDDVLLYNEDGHATESTIANLVVEIDGTLFTPPVECGLLPGTARADLLDRGLLQERPIPLPLLRTCPRLYLLNSVRGLFPARLDAPHLSTIYK